ncbi:DNA topoisomerase 3-alpha [Piliocolobus tephrosceles]|uniref:DNA topoisomerase 3-alpha n=1 Tax=Piliocolobus tephrosceles TaxID=591936 RepID=UPI00130142E2|nr:DNA topoisomerase 3-alpha [Piliocolobus tephrosceles]
MIFPVLRYALRWLRQPGDRAFSRPAMEVALRGVRKVLCVAEKNDAAKGIADLLSNGRMRRREGLSKFNKIYEFDYHLYGQNVTMVMTSVSGHLLAHDFRMQFRKWQSCNPLVLFEAEIEKYCPENFVDIKKTLERETRQCQALVIWTDCDREGENIGFEIIHVCKAVKPNLQVLRARFSEITPHAVRTACENLTEPDQRVSDAVDVRQELDLRIGAAFTRFQTLRLQKIFPEVLAEQLISYGSCQFPTLGFVVERFKAIQAFVPEIFHRIKVTHDHKDGIVEFNWKRHRLFNHTACLVLYQLCMEDPMATVVEVRSKPKSKWRPQALDTVELEKLASRKLRINAKETMRIAEKLYTQGYISYPRTETNSFPRDLNLTVLVEQQTADPRWGAFAQSILERGGPTPRNGNKSDQAHPPIHPTKYTNSLQGDEQRLYEFIVRHFLACCSQDAQGQETTVEIDIAQERFVAHGLMILARNYLDVYPYDHWSDKILPVYERGSRFQPSTVEMVDGETSPPKLLTEADLIALMEKHGIGQWLLWLTHISLKLKFKRGSLPPTMPLEFVCCIGGCDETLREILDLRFSWGPPRAIQPSGHLQASQSVNRMDNSQHLQPADSRQTGPSKALARTLPPPTAAGESNSVTCNCGQEAVLLTVRKEGPNQGRQFFKCNGGSCNFFLWADSPNPGAGGPPASAYRPLGGSLGRPPGPGIHLGGFGNPGDGSGTGTSCLCSQPTVTRTVQKDGPNKGRQFHTCAKPREQQCGFFQWVDENTAPGTSGAPSWTGDRGRILGSEARSKRSRASSSDTGSTAKKPRKCSLCHQPGHTRPFCPQNR